MVQRISVRNISVGAGEICRGSIFPLVSLGIIPHFHAELHT